MFLKDRVSALFFSCTLYTSKLFKIIKAHLPNVHCYADDTQLYLAFKPGTNLDAAVKVTESCITEIRRWMLSEKLKLNVDKTEFVIIGTKQQLEKVNIDHLCVGDHRIKPSSVVKNLGSWFDSKLNMLCHIQKTWRLLSAFFHLYNIRRIRKYFTRQYSFIFSKIGYSNGLLYGLPYLQVMTLDFISPCSTDYI